MRNQKGNRSEKRKGALEPKPPEILQKLLWLWLHGREHLEIILSALLILFISSCFILPEFDITNLISRLIKFILS